jgi:hypothetical protein
LHDDLVVDNWRFSRSILLLCLPATGLDIFAGTLSRYYSGDWETIIQQSGRLAGSQFESFAPNPYGLPTIPSLSWSEF